MNSQQRIEEIREPNPISLRDKAKQGSIALEAPGATGFDHLQTWFIISVEQNLTHPTRGIPVSELQGVRAEPADAHHANMRIGKDSSYPGVRSQIFKPRHGYTPFGQTQQER